MAPPSSPMAHLPKLKNSLPVITFLSAKIFMKQLPGRKKFPLVAAACKAPLRFARCGIFPPVKKSSIRGTAQPLAMDELQTTIDSVFRQESGRILATLIRISGSFDLAEEAMQEAFATAVANWPAKGVPDNPGAWLTSVAHRKLMDHSRRERTRREKQEPLLRSEEHTSELQSHV